MIRRKLTIDDEEIVTIIIKSCTNFLCDQGIEQWSEEYPNWQIVKKDILESSVYGFFEDDSLIAMITVNTKEDIEYKDLDWSFKGETALVVHRLAVDPKFQGRGIGKILLRFIDEYAIENNYRIIRLDAFSHNKRANSLYSNYGYKFVGTITFRGRTIHNNCYERLLSFP